MDLTSYAELAVRLVNTAGLGHEGGDLLTSMDGLRALVSDREHLSHGMTRADLETLLMLRDEFRGFFVSCSQGNGAEAAARLNELLIQYPVHPQLSGHDGQAWHVHYTESGSMSDKYAAGAAMGLAVRLADLGLDRFGVCQAAPCPGSSSTRRSTAPGGTARTAAPAGPTSPPTGPASAAKNPALSPPSRARILNGSRGRPRRHALVNSFTSGVLFAYAPECACHKPYELETDR